MSKPNDKAKKSELPNLAEIPEVSSDFRLGFAHNDALDFARDIILDAPKEDISSLFRALHMIFHQWKLDHGLPRSNTLAGALGGKRETQLSEKDRQEKIKSLNPWHTHAYAKTPIALFNALKYEKYAPLNKFLDEFGWRRMSEIEAILILDSHDSKSSYQSSDCISAALRLAKRERVLCKAEIKFLTKDAKGAFIARQNSRKTRRTKRENTDRAVLEAYQELTKSGVKPSALQKQISTIVGITQPAVSKAMARLREKNFLSNSGIFPSNIGKSKP